MFPKRSLRVDIARKRSRSLHTIQRLLKSSYLRASWLLILLALLMLLLVVERSPVSAQVEVTPIVQMPNSSQLMQQGKTAYSAGQFADAAQAWQQAAQVYQSQGDKLNQARALSFVSLAYQQLGQWQAASVAIASSLQLLKDRDLQDKLILAQALNTQGHLQLALGQAELALTTWQQAAATYAQAGYNAGVTGSLINQAQALQNLGFYRRANKTLTQLEQTLQNQPDSLLKATGLRSLGNALQVVGNLEQSRRVLQQSLATAEHLQSPQEIAAALLSLGNTARALHDNSAALKFYQQASLSSTSPTTRVQAQLNQLSLLLESQLWSAAQALWPQIQPEIANLPPSRTAVYARINFAQSLMKLASWGSGEPSSYRPINLSSIAQLLATAVQQAKSIKDTRAESYALGHLGELYEQTQQFRSATDLTQQALSIAEAIDAADITYLWQWQLGRLLKAQGNISGALTAYTQAVNTLQSLRSDLVAINPDVQFSFREHVEPIYRALVELHLRQTASAQPSQEDLKQARKTIESLQLAELENFFRSACLDAKVEIDKVIEQNNSTAALYAIILAQRLEIIVKLPNQEKLLHYTTTVAQEQVESTVASLQEYLRDVTRTSEVKKQSQQLYDWLIQPAQAQLAKSGIKTLVFVLDGSLRNIPMAVLYNSQQQKYLVEEYAIALTPGLQLVAPKPRQRLQLNALIAGVSEKRFIDRREFAPLENVAQELQRIQSQVSKSKQLLNQQFTETNLQNQLKSASFSVVHLATHGEFSSNPEDTFILTWDRLLKVKDFDNLLRVNSPSGSKIELLVLSACQTAIGDKRAALGLAGVAVQAGAHSTLATLWSVDDASTTDLMSQFYQQLKTGVTKASALQLAQLAILKQEKRPYFWAPYILVGNWL